MSSRKEIVNVVIYWDDHDSVTGGWLLKGRQVSNKAAAEEQVRLGDFTIGERCRYWPERGGKQREASGENCKHRSGELPNQQVDLQTALEKLRDVWPSTAQEARTSWHQLTDCTLLLSWRLDWIQQAAPVSCHLPHPRGRVGEGPRHTHSRAHRPNTQHVPIN